MSGPFKLKYKNSAFPFKSALKDKGDKDHQNAWGEDHKHPPGEKHSFAEISLSDEDKKKWTGAGAEFGEDTREPLDATDTAESRCDDNPKTEWVNGKCVSK